MYPVINLRIPTVLELWKNSYWSLRHRGAGPTCPGNKECRWLIFWEENVVVGRLLIFCSSSLWTFEGTPELWDTQPERRDVSDGISSQNMTTRLSADPDVINLRFLELDFIRTPNISKIDPVANQDSKKSSIHFTTFLFTLPGAPSHKTILLSPFVGEFKKKVSKRCCQVHQV